VSYSHYAAEHIMYYGSDFMGIFEYAGNYNFVYFENGEPEVSTSWPSLIVDLCKNVALIEIRCPHHEASCCLCRCCNYIGIVLVDC
jgi:hypothetical protein